MSRKIKIALLNSTDENSRWIINRYLDQFKANKNLTDSDIKRLVEIKEYNNFNKKICESRCKLNYEEGKNKGYIKGNDSRCIICGCRFYCRNFNKSIS